MLMFIRINKRLLHFVGIALGCIPSLTGPTACQISADGEVVIAAFAGHQETVFSFYIPGSNFLPNVHSTYGVSARPKDQVIGGKQASL